MKNGWTGGQYSVFRAVFALGLCISFLLALPQSTGWTTGLLALGSVLSIFLAIGLYDRAATLALCCIRGYLLGRETILANPGILCVGWLLAMQLFLPPAPYGSWAGRGRVDPGGGWRMPPMIFAATWFVLALAYVYDGYSKLVSPTGQDDASLASVGTWIALTLELAFGPLALVRPLRPWLWCGMLLVQLAWFAFHGFAELGLGLLVLHLFCWDPGWVRPLSATTERLFYDGHCGLCQRSVRLLLAEDSTGTAFRFAPLQGETFQTFVSARQRDALPLSLVVQTEKGTLLTRSRGVLHILRRLGGLWRLLAGVLVLLPVGLRDRFYDGVARIRHRLFARPAEACPLMPPRMRARFDP